MSPQRIQRKRTKGFRLPPNTVCVDRTSRYGNPWKVVKTKHGYGVQAPDGYVDDGWTLAGARSLAARAYRRFSIPFIEPADLARIAAADFVACFCDPDDGMACHGDPLIEAALAANPEVAR